MSPRYDLPGRVGGKGKTVPERRHIGHLDPIHGSVYHSLMPKKKVMWDAHRVKALRRHLGLTQQELADHLGTRQQTISEWETGMYRPRGASSTLLTVIAERAGFEYKTGADDKA